MTTEGRKKFALLALTILLTVVAGRQLMPGADGGSARRDGRETATSPLSSRVDVLAEIPEVSELRIDRLQTAAGVYSPGRDPFRFSARPGQEKRDNKNADSAKRRARAEAQKAQRQAAVERKPPKPQPPPVDVVFLGSFGSEARRLAVFSDGSEIYNVLEGDVLKDRFVVERIGYESADVAFLGFPDVPARRLEIGG